MSKRSKPAPPSTDEAQPPAPPESRYHIERYQRTRHWGLYDGTALLAVTVYKRGAAEVLQRLQTLEQQLADQQQPCDAVPAPFREQPTERPPTLAPHATGPVWKPPEQIPLLAAEDMPASRATSPRRRPVPSPYRS